MLCRLNPTIHSRFSSHIDLKVYIITFISLGPAMVRIIEVPLATLLLDSKMDLARKLNITHEAVRIGTVPDTACNSNPGNRHIRANMKPHKTIPIQSHDPCCRRSGVAQMMALKIFRDDTSIC